MGDLCIDYVNALHGEQNRVFQGSSEESIVTSNSIESNDDGNNLLSMPKLPVISHIYFEHQ